MRLILLLFLFSGFVWAESDAISKRALCLSFVERDVYNCRIAYLDVREGYLCEALAMEPSSRTELIQMGRHCQGILNASIPSYLSASRQAEIRRTRQDLYRFCKAYQTIFDKSLLLMKSNSSASNGAFNWCDEIGDSDQRFRCHAVVTKIAFDQGRSQIQSWDRDLPRLYCAEKIKDDELSRSCLSMISHHDFGYAGVPSSDPEVLAMIMKEVNRSRCNSIRNPIN